MDEPLRAGRFAENVVHFARALRAAGLPVGTDRVLLALDGVALTGIGSREQFRAVLAACLIDRVEHRELFDQAFDLFWRDPDLLARLLATRLPDVKSLHDRARPPRANRRLAEALAPRAPALPEPEDERFEIEASMSFSSRELLHKADFDAMTRDEWAAATAAVAQWRLRLPRVRTRRFVAAAHGSRPDWRRLIARMSRRAGDLAELPWRRPRDRLAPIVALVDISGSMSRYSRMFLHFLHAMTCLERSTKSFVFGTRLTPVTRMLRRRDPDRAVDDCVRAVDDWSGGTRISACLHEFNLRWSRRVLGQSATVILVTDGLERDDVDLLGREAERLSKSCHRLLWLNPLLRYDGFEPRAAGVRAILPHVDRHLPVHNLDSLEALSEALTVLNRRSRPDHRSGQPGPVPRADPAAA